MMLREIMIENVAVIEMAADEALRTAADVFFAIAQSFGA